MHWPDRELAHTNCRSRYREFWLPRGNLGIHDLLSGNWYYVGVVSFRPRPHIRSTSASLGQIGMVRE